MAELTFDESYRTHGFPARDRGHHVPGHQVTGLNEGMTDMIEQSGRWLDDRAQDRERHRQVRHAGRRADMDGSEDDGFLPDWFSEMFQLNGDSGGSSRRRNGAVVKLENGVEVLRFAFYRGHG